MFQETTQALQDNPDTMVKAISFGAIGFNVLIISLTTVLLLGAYALRSLNTEIATYDWVRTNRYRWIIGFLMITGLSILLVVTPDINTVLQALGFNPDKSPVALGIAVTLLLLGATSQPTKVPKGEL